MLVEQGIVRYVSRSLPLKEAGGWIPIGAKLPAGSVANEIRTLRRPVGCSTIAADEWFEDWRRGGTVVEDARHWPTWDQTLSLIWFEDLEILENNRLSTGADKAHDVQELDGILPWPSKKRRR